MAENVDPDPVDLEASGQVPKCNPFSDEQKKQILFTGSFTAIGSMVFCIIAVTMVIGLRLYTRFAYRLAMYQVLGSLFWSLSNVLLLLQLNYDQHSESSRASCYLEAFTIEYSMWVKLLFTLWLVFHLFCYVVLLKNLKKLEWLYVTSTVFFPLVCIVWIPFIHGNYGIAGAWCFIRIWKDDCATEKYPEGIAEMFALFYAPVAVALALIALAIFIMVVVMVQRAYRNKDLERQPFLAEHNEANRKVVKQLLPLLAYPIIYFALFLFPLINRLYDTLGNGTGYAFDIAHVFTSGIMGFFAGLALMIHICCLKFPSKSSRPKARKETDNLASRNPSSSYANLSTANTRYSLQRESVVDENLRHSTGIY